MLPIYVKILEYFTQGTRTESAFDASFLVIIRAVVDSELEVFSTIQRHLY